MTADDLVKRVLAVGLCELVSGKERADPVAFMSDWLRSSTADQSISLKINKTEASLDSNKETAIPLDGLLDKIRGCSVVTDKDKIEWLAQLLTSAKGVSLACICAINSSGDEAIPSELNIQQCKPENCPEMLAPFTNMIEPFFEETQESLYINEVLDSIRLKFCNSPLKPGALFICAIEYASVLSLESIEADVLDELPSVQKKTTLIVSTVDGSGEPISSEARRGIRAVANEISAALRRSEDTLMKNQRRYMQGEVEKFYETKNALEQANDKYTFSKELMGSDMLEELLSNIFVVSPESENTAWAACGLLGLPLVPRSDGWSEAKIALLDARSEIAAFSPTVTEPRKGLLAHHKLAAIQAILPESVSGVPLGISILHHFAKGALELRVADIAKRKESLALQGEEKAEDVDDDF